MSGQEQEQRSPAAGACVVVLLVCAAFAAVFAASTAAGVLAVWMVGALALVRAVTRRMSDSSATPPPGVAAPTGDVYAGETGDVARVVHGPEGVTCTIHPVRQQITVDSPDQP